LAIPTIKNIESTNFLFTQVDRCCQRFLTPTILKMQRYEINQSLYYSASLFIQDTSFDNEDNIIISDNEDENVDSPKITLQQLLEVVEQDNVNEIWEIKIGNSLLVKHYVVLLKNDSHICSCIMIVQQ
ncbi:7480_t:CDS:1, partial [Gigaspora margarita]